MLNLVEIKVSTIKQWINIIPSSEASLIWQVYRIRQEEKEFNHRQILSTTTGNLHNCKLKYVKRFRIYVYVLRRNERDLMYGKSKLSFV